MNNSLKHTLNAAMYFVAFALVQFAVNIIARLTFKEEAANATQLVASSVASSAILVALFAWRKWSPVSRQYVSSHPWDTLTWTALCAMGMVTVSSFITDMTGARMSDEYVRIFSSIMNHKFGYLAIGIVAPVAEEMVFRGAILRSLLEVFGKRTHWLPIIVSALLFGMAHGNMAQAVNATLLGLLLGWMYYRTGSIVPGVVFHWMNNTIAYVMFKLMPGTADMTLSELCGNDPGTVALYVTCSLCVVVPSLYQLSFRMKRG